MLDAVNCGLALHAVFSAVDGNLAVFGSLEESQGHTDLNGDGDAVDLVFHTYVVSITQALIDLLDGLPPDAFEETMTNSLVSKVRTAEARADRDSICAAVNSLGAFKAEVEAQRGHKLDDATADRLIELADAFIAQLLAALPEGETCGGPGDGSGALPIGMMAGV